LRCLCVHSLDFHYLSITRAQLAVLYLSSRALNAHPNMTELYRLTFFGSGQLFGPQQKTIPVRNRKMIALLA
jgi:hypothetical protein